MTEAPTDSDGGSPSEESPYDLDRELRALTRALMVDESLAAEAVQDAWLVILGRHRGGVDSLKAWLRRVARPRVIAAVQRRARMRGVEARYEEIDRIAQQAGPAQLEDSREVLRKATRDMEEPYRTVLERRFLGRQEVFEIATALARPEGLVRTQLTRGIAKLRRVLDKPYGGRGRWAVTLLPLAGLSSRTIRAPGLIEFMRA